ncbi:MAG: hypothetical protein Q9209_000049 [Squamulea sp. 1 TL-2023]
MDPWVHINFRVNAFTSDEWPPQAHSKLEDLSIGEEQSPSWIVALSWSPLGLAKHKRFALAILTTNYRVSLWASDSDLTSASTWRRVLVVNKSLQTPVVDQSLVENHERRLARIRSMSWAPGKIGLGAQTSSSSISGEASTAYPVQYLAVTNDAGGVVILDVRSPWLHHGHMWEAQVTHYVDWKDLLPYSLSHIAVINNQYEIELLSYQPSEKVEDNTQILSKTFTLVDEWDAISGLAFVSIAGEVVLHASSFLSGSFAYRILPEHGANTKDAKLNETHWSALHDQATTLQKDFDRHHDLGGLSHVKTWGLASWGPYVASCITMHPSDMIEYSMTSEHRCHVLFSHGMISNGLEEDIVFPWQDASRTMPQETSSAVLDKILIILSEMAILRTTTGTLILYNICCAAMVCFNIYEWHRVEKILRGLSISNGTSLEPEFSFLNNIKASQVTMLERTSHLNAIANARTESQDPATLHVQGPTSPAASLKANLSFANLMAFPNVPTDRKASIAVSTDSSNNPNRTLDHFDIPSSAEKADPDEQIAAHALAEFVDYPNDSHTATKSPPPKHHFRSGSVSVPAMSGAASFVTTSSAQPDASTRAIKSPRGSISTGGSFATPNAVGFPGSRKQSVASGASRSISDGFPASEAVPSKDADDSPTLGPKIDRFPLPPTTKPKKGKARDSMLLNRHSHTTDGSTKAQNERKTSIDTQDTSEKAEQGLHLPFLPKFLKLAGSPRQSMSAAEPENPRSSREITEVDEIPPKEQNQAPVKSIFEDESSDEDANQTYDEHAFIGGAKLAASRRATLIATEKASGKRVVSMQDILKEGGVEAVADHLQRDGTSVLADSNPGPSSLKAKRMLGESSIKMKRAGIVGMPSVHETSGGVQVSLDGAGEPVKGNPSWLDGLRSNPVKRAATTPARKRVTLPLEVGDEHRVRKDSIVSTPYPLGYKGRRSEDMEDQADMTNSTKPEKRLGEGEAVIILVLHSHSSTTPMIRKLVVPGRRETDVVDEDEKKPQFRAKIVEDFDDEKLFQLIKRRYIDMRGIVNWFTSARGVKGINLLGYHRLSQLAAKEDRSTRRKTFRVYDDVFAEQRMLDLWKSPRSGRKKREWVEWIRRLPRYSEGLHANEENVALELVEGWNMRKIGFALSLVVVLSLLGTLLWTFLGVNGGVRLQNDATVGYPVELRMMSAGFRQAGTRVQTGLALGILVLLLGWTGVGAWILLSWLVM